jgi:hypothetical protein
MTMPLQPDPWAVLADAVKQAQPEQCPQLMGQLEHLKASLWLRMTMGTAEAGHSEPDTLLTAEVVGKRLNVTTGFVYRNARSYPLMIRQGRYVRFSSHGLEQYLKRHQGH